METLLKSVEILYRNNRIYKHLKNLIENLVFEFKRIIKLKRTPRAVLSRLHKRINTIERDINIYKRHIPNMKLNNFKQLRKAVKEYENNKLIEDQRRNLERIKEENRIREIETKRIFDNHVLLLMRLNREYLIFDRLKQNAIKPINIIKGKLYDIEDVEYYFKDKQLIQANEFIVTRDERGNAKAGYAIKKVYEDSMADPNIDNIIVKILYLWTFKIQIVEESTEYDGQVTNIYYRMAITFSNNTEMYSRRTTDFRIPTTISNAEAGSDIQMIAIGYEIKINRLAPRQVKEETKFKLLAFNPSNNRKYHHLTTATTGNDRICIYESFMDCINELKLSYMRKNKDTHDYVMKKLKDEGEEIEKNVKEGHLIKSLELLSAKYDKEIILFFYDNEQQYPLSIKGDKIEELKEDINKYKFGKCLIYSEKDKHVGVTNIYKLSDKQNKQINNKKLKTFMLKMKEAGTIKDINNVLGYDSETYNEFDYKARPYCFSIYGKLNGVEISKVFYGVNCEKEFTKYILSIRTKLNHSKTRQKQSIEKIFIYGFNNSGFDNLFIYKKLYDDAPYIKIQFGNNKIKYIKLDNVHFYDISLIYSFGTLRDTAKEFNLPISKSYFPYKFPNKDNLEYIGAIPDVSYWNNSEEYEEGKKLLPDNIFNMKEFTSKYCLLDSKLVYELALLHLKNATGQIEINQEGIGNMKFPYDVRKCPTSANMALKIFQQVFLKEALYPSNINMQEKERLAYKGGRCEVFKKGFKENDKVLNYIDINSSYPFSMTQMMPHKYQETTRHDDLLLEENNIIDYYLYYAKSEYKGDNKYIIPNLLVRNEKKEINSFKSTGYAYHWGVELREAIKNGFDIHIREIHIYEGKIIFKEFAEYMYNERKKNKKTNKALALFYKIMLNSLYGKFGQKVYEKSILLKEDDYSNFFNNADRLLLDWEVIDDTILCSYKDVGDDEESIGQLIRFASYISAYSRSHLSEVMRDIGHEHVYYCDTDSIFTDKLPDKKYLDNDILGKWKIEHEIKEATFIGKKLYYFKTTENEEVKKAKGINAKLMKQDDYNRLQDNADKPDYINDKLNTDKVFTADKIMFFRDYNKITIKPQERNVKAIYNKRIFEGNNSMSR